MFLVIVPIRAENTIGIFLALEAGMLYYTIGIAGLKRSLPICRVTDDVYIAGLVIFGDVELTVACAAALLAIAPEYDYMISPEAKSIPLIYEMARQSGAGKYFLARKSPKLYMRGVFESDVTSITTAHPQKLYLDIDDASLMRGKRILIVDDVISTGESLLAVEGLVNKAGGKVTGRMAILAEGSARSRNDIIYLAPLPLFNPDGTVKE
jgi:adenine phosphoribosyltransferase